MVCWKIFRVKILRTTHFVNKFIVDGYLVIIEQSIFTCNSYNMGTSALPDMYARSPRAAGPRFEVDITVNGRY